MRVVRWNTAKWHQKVTTFSQPGKTRCGLTIPPTFECTDYHETNVDAFDTGFSPNLCSKCFSFGGL